jgi:hypothetical protein
MHHPLPHTLPPMPSARWPLLAAIRTRVLDAWRTLLMDERTRYLSQSANAGELEQRLRQWDDYCVNRAWQRTLW